jgi:sulfur-oxidizing protein SoxB
MLKGKAIEAGKTYKVAGWAPVAEGAKGDPIWDVMEAYFKNHKTIGKLKLNTPKLVGMEGNPGIAI